MPFRLESAVYPNAARDFDLNVGLLRRANAWLQRRNANVSDDLLLIGVGFAFVTDGWIDFAEE